MGYSKGELGKLANDLKPYIVGWFGYQAGSTAVAASGGMETHGLNSKWHTGQLAQSQAPWAVTDDEFAVHIADPNVHHYAATGSNGISVTAGQVVSFNVATDSGLEFASLAIRVGLAGGLYASGGVIGLGTPGAVSSTSTASTATGTRNDAAANGHSHPVTAYSSGIVNPGHLLKTDSNGDAGIRWLTTNKLLAATYLDHEVGNGVRFQNDKLLRSLSFDSSFPIQGWQINEVAGVPGKSALTIGSISADELYVRIFVANETRVDRGELYLAKSYGFTTLDFSTPSSIGGTVRVYFEDSPALNGAIFSNNDWIMFNLYDDSGTGLIISQIWGQVSSYIDEDPGRENEQSWLFTLRLGATNFTVKKGSFCVGWGASGQGIIKMSTIDQAGAPYIKLARWAGANPYTPANNTTLVHLGKLSAASGSPVGTYGLMLFGTTGQSVEVSESGIFLTSAKFVSYNGANQTVEILPIGDMKLGSNLASSPGTTFVFTASTGALRLGPGSGGPTLNWSGSLLALRNSAGTDVIQLDSSGNSAFTGVMTIGTSGEIRQGTGTWGTNYTGLRVWNASGVGRIAGYNSSTLQWEANSLGEIRAGTNLITLAADGIAFGRYASLTMGTIVATTDNKRSINWWDDLDARTGSPLARIYSGRGSDSSAIMVIDVDPSNANANLRPSIWLKGTGTQTTAIWFNKIHDIVGIPGIAPSRNPGTLVETVNFSGNLMFQATLQRDANYAAVDLGTSGTPFRTLYVDSIVASNITGGTQITGSIWQYDSGDMYVRSSAATTRTLYVTNPGVGVMNLDVDGSANIQGSLTVTGTVDGVDISTFKSGYDTHVANVNAHHAQAHAYDSTTDHTGTLSWSKVSKTGSSLADLATRLYSDLTSRGHVLATNTALGADHTISGATAGHVLRASGATTALFAQLQHGDLGGVTADQHHAQAHAYDSADHTGTLSWAKVNKTGASLADLPTRLYSDLQTRTHVITGADHSVTGSVYQVLGIPTTINTLGLLTPASSPGANTLVMTDAASAVTLVTLYGTTKVQTPLIDTAVGTILTLKPTLDLLLDPDSNVTKVAASVWLQSSDYASFTTGWGVSPAGLGDFRKLQADEIVVKSFIADLEQALAGGQIISKSVAVLAQNFTAPHNVTAAITFRAKATVSANATSVTVTKPVGTVQFDVMIAHVIHRSTVTITTVPAGWTLIASYTSGSTTVMEIYYRVAGAAEGASYQWIASGSSNITGTIQSFYNVNTTTPIHAFAGQGGLATTSATAPSITPTIGGTALLFLAGFSDTANTTTTALPPAGFTEREDVLGNTLNWIYAADSIQAGFGATGTKIATISSNHQYAAALVALLPATWTTVPLVVQDLPSAPNMAVFQENDVVLLRSFSRAGGGLSISNCWGVVTGYTDNPDGTQTWTFTRSASPNDGTVAQGSIISANSLVLDFGVAGNGYIESNAIDGTYGSNSPYIQTVVWAGHPATGQAVRTRMGNLLGITGTAGEYGLWAGSKAGVSLANTDTYLRVSNQGVLLNNVPLKIFDTLGTQTVNIDVNGQDVWIGTGKLLYWNGSTLAITGTVTATAGTIGGWTLGATALTAGSGATSRGIDSGGTNPAFYAGSATPSSAPFRVSSAGVLYATGATIIGAITANSGSIAGTLTMGASGKIDAGDVDIDTRGIVCLSSSVGYTASAYLQFVDGSNNQVGSIRNYIGNSGTGNILTIKSNGATASTVTLVGEGTTKASYVEVSSTLIRLTSDNIYYSTGTSGDLAIIHKGMIGVTGGWFDRTVWITSTGVMEAGKYIDFHYTNTDQSDYSIRLTADAGTIWSSAGLAGSALGTTSGYITSDNGILFTNVAASAYQQISTGNIYNYGGGYYGASHSFMTAAAAASDVRVGSLLASSSYSHASRVPTNGIYSYGPVLVGDATSITSGFAFEVYGGGRITGAWRTDVCFSMKVQASTPAASATYGILYVNSSGQLYYLKPNASAPGLYVVG